MQTSPDAYAERNNAKNTMPLPDKGRHNQLIDGKGRYQIIITYLEDCQSIDREFFSHNEYIAIYAHYV